MTKQYTLTRDTTALDQAHFQLSCSTASCVLGAPLIAAIVIPAGSFIVSGSIVAVGNTLHWLEAQGRCDDSMLQRGLDQLSDLITSGGSVILQTSQDALNWLKSDPPQQP